MFDVGTSIIFAFFLYDLNYGKARLLERICTVRQMLTCLDKVDIQQQLGRTHNGYYVGIMSFLVLNVLLTAATVYSYGSR